MGKFVTVTKAVINNYNPGSSLLGMVEFVRIGIDTGNILSVSKAGSDEGLKVNSRIEMVGGDTHLVSETMDKLMSMFNSATAPAEALERYVIEFEDDDEVIHFELPTKVYLDPDMVSGGYEEEFSSVMSYLTSLGAVNLRFEYIHEYPGVTIRRG